MNYSSYKKSLVLFSSLLTSLSVLLFLTGCFASHPELGTNGSLQAPPPPVTEKVGQSQLQQQQKRKDDPDLPPNTMAAEAAVPASFPPQAVVQPHVKQQHTANKVNTTTGARPLVRHEPAAPATQRTSSTDKGLVFNFDHADLSDVIMTLAELLNINYLLVSEVTGNVTIQTSGSLGREDLFPLFYQLLEINGLTAVKEGNLYKIVSFKEASRLLPDFRTSSDQPIPLTERGAQIQIIPLQYISPEEMTKILTPFISAEGSIISHENSKTILLVDQRVNINKALRLIKTFDVNMFDNMNYRFIQLQHTSSQDIIGPLKQIVTLYTKERAKDVEIIDLNKMNSLLVFTANKAMFAKIDEFISKLDIPSQDVSPHIYIYFLKNSRSEDMMTLLDSIFTETIEETSPPATPESEKEKEKKTGSEENPFAMKPATAEVSITQKNQVKDFGSGTLRGEVKFTEDPIRNALIIEAIPSDYAIVEKVLKRLDILPRQVLISVSIIEVRLDDGLDLGVEWSYSHENGATTDTPSFWQAATGGDGFLYTIGQTDKWQAAINALAQENRVNILSTPSVLASDNKDATINIATEIPVASAQIQYDNDNTNKTQTDIQYRNTGIILNVTPRINEFGIVSMEISQEVSEQEPDPVAVGESSYPSFFKRSVKTTLTVNDGQTIVIGGLIREKINDGKKGVPLLMDIPVIGWLFGSIGQTTEKSELIILIKPSVVTTLDDVDAVTEEFTRKAGYDLQQLH